MASKNRKTNKRPLRVSMDVKVTTPCENPNMAKVYNRFSKEWVEVDKRIAELSQIILTLCPAYASVEEGGVQIELQARNAELFVTACASVIGDGWMSHSIIDVSDLREGQAILTVIVRFPLSDYDKVVDLMKQEAADNGVHIIASEAA